ncbi:hypothetical protein PR003_g15819 [Phytophthora rubi]|uniref:Uncharacterized protein n=1 Tax=Phytophthora rubi TaxID=129364 RepID=A0A6A3KZ25_9STRA|nr:hypothetical protein PR002_g14769 [Phytophthora rubi]KAE9015270.1 hypothetical protein PR001_g14943 [Phytophthora rubi]KAE9328280.1 hypothetical protein PR003_g15819 [Phytophthora rubi]
MEWGTHFFVRYFSHLVKKERPEGEASRPRSVSAPDAAATVLGESPPAGDGGVLKETYVECSGKITHADPRPLHWSPYGASDSPAKTPANATLKFDVELLAFGPKAKEM